MKQTNQEVKMHFRGHDITIPKGTRITNKTAIGIDEKYNFVADLNWIPPVEIGGKQIKNYTLIHDATYYGIDVPAQYVSELTD